ncbi:predicted protein [Chaetomium globosum CBS 148.51]|uniref:FluG domain-containing protein n=1 Tax=Chaetomium globosum (strain ATCC 6205 / CBS 148.51 / DSM 1962 / NBRC 6347 / NRRL 1970) TaxID=306901 RepID=Q2H9H1_CHAGB|nr:uncharacterized protein CHGG_03133 [Chaetomium globosum CBS 148.51]EAQ91198.1 predicted protein [Chaetomium globosum CBS 148.51]
MKLAVLAAEFGRAGPPFSGALTVRALGHSQRPNFWAATQRPHLAPPSNERPRPGRLVQESIDSGIQESVFFNLASIFGSPAKRRAAAQPGVKWRPSHFSSFPACRPSSLEPVALDTQHQTLTTSDTQRQTLNAIAMPARCPPRPRDRNADFVRQFTAKQREVHEDRIAKQAKALTADQHAALRKQLEVIQFLPPAYADATKINVVGILRKWKSGFEHWRNAVKGANRATAMSFLQYLCQTYRITSWGTSWQYFRQYKQLYANVTGRYMDTNDSKEIKKDVANVDALLVLVTFNIRYDTAIFPWERHRIQLPGCYLGLAFTGARPAEFVDGETKTGKDEYTKEILSQIAATSIPSDEDEAPDEDSRLLEKMILQELGDRGRPKALCYEDVLLMIVCHPETGEDMLVMYIRLAHHKGMDNKPKPTIFYFTPTKRLIFCFISIIVSLAVHDRAFAVSKFTNVRKVFQAKNRGPVKCIALRWKEEWLKRPIFRQRDKSIAEEESDEREYEPLPYHRLLYDMEWQSLDAGEEKKVEPKAWRRGAANAANGGRYRIKGSENEARIRELTKLIATKEQQRKKAVQRGYRKHYFHNRPTWDMETDGEEEEEYDEPAIDLQIPERAQFAEILCNQPDNLSSTELLELRIQAAELMVALCGKRETVKRNHIRRRAQTQANVTVKESPGPDPFPLLMDRKQCPYCIDEKLSHEERTFKYCRPAVMYDHFDRKHARQLSGVKQISCNHPKCKEGLEFKHLNHYKNHVERVHDVKLRV